MADAAIETYSSQETHPEFLNAFCVEIWLPVPIYHEVATYRVFRRGWQIKVVHLLRFSARARLSLHD
jgi:hypothetical protein